MTLGGDQVFEQRGPHESEMLARAQHSTQKPTWSHEESSIEETSLQFLDLILSGDRQGAVRLLVARLEAGDDADALMVEVVDHAEAEMTRRVEAGTATVHQLRHCDAACLLGRVMLKPPVFSDMPLA